MRLGALFPLVGCILNLLVAVFVLWAGPRQTSNRVYFGWGLAVSIWNLGAYGLFTVKGPEAALFWARFLWFGVIFIPVLLYHLSLSLAQIQRKRSLYAAYGVGIFLALSNFTPLFVSSVREFGNSGYYSVPGPLFYCYNAFFSLVFFTIGVLIKRRQALPVHQRSRLDALIVGQTILVLFGTNDLLPITGMDYYPFTDVMVYPYGSTAAVLYGLIFAYSVLQRNLLDIQVQLSGIAAQFVRFLFLFFIGLTLLLTATLIAPDQISSFAFFTTLAVLLGSGIMASMLFPKLFGGQGLDKLERRILGDCFEYQDQVRQFIANMTWYSDLNTLLDDLHGLFTRTLGVENYQIILRDEATRAFSVQRAWPEQPGDTFPDVEAQSPVCRYFEWGKGEYLSLSKSSVRFAISPVERQAREQLQCSGAEMCFALTTQNEPFGLLLMGAKSGSEPYTATDINLMVSLVKTMALMVSQIRLKTQIMNAQELDLLGRMSRGMAHDLNNLLTPLSTLLQLSTESGVLDDELLPVAMRNVGVMRAYIKEALFFSENLRPDFQLTRMDVLIQQAAEVARTSRDKDILVTTETPGEILVEMDSVLVQRMIANLITNAIDASPEGTHVRVLLERVAHADALRDWVSLRIIDQGEGISRENLARVSAPYFTTKNRGDENRGFGLGLAICRKIVTLHGGHLTIESQLRKGTTVRVDIPRHQEQSAVAAALSTAA